MSIPNWRFSNLPIGDFGHGLDSNTSDQAVVFVPSQTTNYNVFANAQPGLHAESSQLQLAAIDYNGTSMSQQCHYQQQKRHQELQQLQNQPCPQQYQQQSANMSWTRQQQAFKDHTRARQHHQQQLRSQPQGQQRYHSPMNPATPSPLLTQQQTPKQKSNFTDADHKPLVVTTPSIYAIPGLTNTTKQFLQPYQRPVTPKPRAAGLTTLPSPQLTPVRRRDPSQTSSMKSLIPNMQHNTAPSMRVYNIQQNELAERAGLEERRQRIKQHKRRRRELKSEPSALYHSYNEFLWYFPLNRGERPNTYLAGLLANQSVPAEPNSDRGLAIQYAKKSWQNYWELKDVTYVLQQAKKDKDKEMAQRGHMSADGRSTGRC
ncbi:hypothetical protein EKO04_008856 [Ascochyta lentis]|uniref:Uncharacterized protein n=1 Tax=Ascochyta lentis TaxID=205686 RepID=A0A8H7IW45_9PLEO|nr:hypothetical protein EKO04_008856 [Ascochyta lentis]